MNTDIFIKRAAKTHGTLYDYSETIYKNARTKVDIICKKHGKFSQNVHSHINGAHCNICSNIKAAEGRLKNVSDLILESNRIHSNKYDYSGVIYKGIDHNVCIRCPEHGEFHQCFKSHLRGYGCHKCTKRSAFIDTEDFDHALKLKIGEKCDLTNSKYINNRAKIEYKCTLCDSICHSNPWNLLKNVDRSGCKNCKTYPKQLSTQLFIELANKIHGNRYDYTDTIYVNAKTKVSIKCNTCNSTFYQRTTAHLYNESGCPVCKESHGERIISIFLEYNNIPFIRQHTYADCLGVGKRKLRFDFFIPHMNICIEYDGKQHTDSASRYWNASINSNDVIKNDYCISNGIKLKRISYTDKDKIGSILYDLLYQKYRPQHQSLCHHRIAF